MPIYAFSPSRTTNAQLLREVAELGYLEGNVLDVTYGEGKWWTEFKPTLTSADLFKFADVCASYESLPFCKNSFDTVCFDPPYRLNGTPDLGSFDFNYGI